MKRKVKSKAPTKKTTKKTVKTVKNASKPKKTTKKDEFRTHKKNGHPSYIYEKVGNKFKYIGITHSKITHGVKNIELKINPDPKDNSKAYARPLTKKDNKSLFKDKKKGWKLSNDDKKKIDKIIRKK